MLVLLKKPAGRFAACLLSSVIFTPFPTAACLLVLALIAVDPWLNKVQLDEQKISMAFVVALQTIYAALACVVYWFELSPLSWSQARAGALDGDSQLIVAFGSLQMLYILLPLTYGHHKPLVTYKNRVASILALCTGLVASIIVNPQITVFGGGYIGNQAEYPGFMPAVFIISMSAWLLLQKRIDTKHLVVLNLIVGWWLLSGNRSEVLALFVIGNLLFLERLRQRLDIRFPRPLYFFGLGIVAFVGFSFIEYLRTFGIEEIASVAVFEQISSLVVDGALRVQTFGSSIYSATVAAHVASEGQLLLGETLAGQVVNTLPSFIPAPWERYSDITESLHGYEVLGGLGFAGEGIINFGVYGPPIMAYGLATCFLKLRGAAHRSFLAAWFFMSCVLYSPRFILYGFVYFYKLLVLFFCLYLIWAIFRKSSPRARFSGRAFEPDSRVAGNRQQL